MEPAIPAEPAARPTRHLLVIAIGAGALLALTAYTPHWALQLPVILAAAAMLWLVCEVTPRQSYGVGTAFALAWLVPTTAWYYAFMTPLVAFASSVGWALLLGNLFRVAGLHRRFGRVGAVAAFVAAWLTLTGVRLHAPVVEDWWLPHLGYSAWHNTGLVWAARFGGEVLFEGLLLACGAGIVASWYRWRRRGALAAVAVATGLVVALNVVVWNLPATPVQPVIALQAMTRGGVDVPASDADVDDLMDRTLQAVGAESPMTVVWPENSIPEAALPRLAEFAKAQGITLAFHTTETDGDEVLKKVVVVDSSGQVVLTNYKQHLAPDEEVGVPRSSSTQVQLNDQVVTAFVCYDMHYPDVVARMRGADVTYVPLNDAAYGYLQKRFHTADITLRAAQSGSTVVVASTNGPTAIVNSNGVVLAEASGTGPAVVRR